MSSFKNIPAIDSIFRKYGSMKKGIPPRSRTNRHLSARRRVKWHLFGFDDYHLERRSYIRTVRRGPPRCVRALFRLLCRRRRSAPRTGREVLVSRYIHHVVDTLPGSLAHPKCAPGRAREERAFAGHVRWKSSTTIIVD